VAGAAARPAGGGHAASGPKPKPSKPKHKRHRAKRHKAKKAHRGAHRKHKRARKHS
jgi:hypothetical protein